MRSSPMRSSSSKVARRSLSMSSTAVTFPSAPKTGTTISLREALQAGPPEAEGFVEGSGHVGHLRHGIRLSFQEGGQLAL